MGACGCIKSAPAPLLTYIAVSHAEKASIWLTDQTSTDKWQVTQFLVSTRQVGRGDHIYRIAAYT